MSGLSGVVNHRAPVTCYARANRIGELAEETRRFSCLSEFMRWYTPRHHGVASVRAQYLFTDVLLETLTDPPPRPPPGEGRAPAAARTRSGVEVDGEVYRSTWAAFQALNLGDERECVKFRTQLKKAGEGEFNGKRFKIVAG